VDPLRVIDWRTVACLLGAIALGRERARGRSLNTRNAHTFTITLTCPPSPPDSHDLPSRPWSYLSFRAQVKFSRIILSRIPKSFLTLAIYLFSVGPFNRTCHGRDSTPVLPAGAPSSASYSIFPDDYRVPFQKRRLIGIPEGLFQFYNSTSSYNSRAFMLTPFHSTATDVVSHMGLLSEIEKVWVAIDHKLFLWDYVEGCVSRTIPH